MCPFYKDLSVSYVKITEDQYNVQVFSICKVVWLIGNILHDMSRKVWCMYNDDNINVKCY